MTIQTSILLGGIIVSILISISVGFYLSFLYKTGLARWGGLIMLSQAFELTCYLLQWTNAAAPLKHFIYLLQVFLFSVFFISWLLFVFAFTWHMRWIKLRNIAILFTFPAIYLFIMAASLTQASSLRPDGDGLTGSMMISPFVVGLPEIFFVLYSYAIDLLSVVLLARFFLQPNPVFRKLAIPMLAGPSIMAFVGMLELADINPLYPVSIQQVAMASISLLALGIVVDLRLRNVLSSGREKIIEQMQDGLLILDRHDRVVDLNPAAHQIFGVKNKKTGKDTLIQAQPGIGALLEAQAGADSYLGETLIEVDGLKYIYDVNISQLRDVYREPIGRAIILRNVTGRERIANALTERSQELARTNTLITALSVIASRIGSSADTDLMLATLGDEVNGLGFKCGIVTVDPDGTGAVIKYLSFNPALIRTVEKLTGVSAKNYVIPRRYWPDDRALKEKIPVWYSDPGAMLCGMFPAIPRPVADKSLELLGIRSETQLCMLPLVSRNEMIGAMLIWGVNLRATDSNILAVFASQVAGILQNTLAHDIEIKRANELARSNAMILALSKVAARLGNTSGSELVLDSLGGELRKLGLNCAVVTIDPQGESATIKYLSIQTGLQLILEKLIGFSIKGHVIPKRYWPGERLLTEKLPVSYSNAEKIMRQFFPFISETVTNKALSLMEINPSNQISILPLLVNDQVIGAMPIWGADLNLEDNPVLSVFASQVAGILQNVNAFERETHRGDELARSNAMILALSKVAARMDSTLNIAAVLDTFGAELKKLGIESVVGLLDNQNQCIAIQYLSIKADVIRWAESRTGHSLSELTIPRDLWPTEIVITERKPYWDPKRMRGTLNLFPILPEPMQLTAIKMAGMNLDDPICYLPLLNGEEAIGVVAVWGKELVEDDSSALIVFANQIATAITNSKLYKDAQAEIIAHTEAETLVRITLKEKELLLKEVHHRVKNNLQIISSLLNLQSGQIVDQKTKDALRESQNRVRTMALIHEKLYQSSDLAQVDLAAYLKGLVTFLSQSYRGSASRVVMQVEARDIRLNIDSAIPCGLIVNELVSNSLKYAFPENQAGQIMITCQQPSRGNFLLIVGDDGVGLPAGFEREKSPSLGLKLVDSLVKQLNGMLVVDSTNGVSYKISFSVN